VATAAGGIKKKIIVTWIKTEENKMQTKRIEEGRTHSTVLSVQNQQEKKTQVKEGKFARKS
jgi:hypothetical protein